MKNKLLKNKLLVLIVVMAALTRFIGLNSLPPALNRDEAAIGYNAYSILKTSRDEHGQYLPLAFKSIGDYKMPLYIYATVLPVKLFGLNDFSIRFWSALAGLVSVVAIYYITQGLIKAKIAPFLAAFLLAFNPWALFYSRIGFEANLALALFLTGLCMLLRGRKKTSWFYGGLILFLLAFLTYSSSLIFIPLFLVIILFSFRRQLTKPKTVGLLVFAFLSIIIFKGLWTISAQKSNITVFSDPTILKNYSQRRTQIYQQNPLLARTWWNKKVFMTRLVAGNYLKTFTPKFLLLEGSGHPWHRIPGVGSFYYLEIILAVIGLIWLIKSKNKNLRTILLAWLLLAPLPSAITVDAPHSTRSLHLLPAVIILAALGFSHLYQKIKTKSWLKLVLTALFLINLVYAGYRYLNTYPSQISASLAVGLKESIQFVNQQNISGNIYLTDIHASTYLYPLVYTRFDPITFQQQAVWTKPDPAGLISAYRFGQFAVVDDLKDIKDPQAVILFKDQEYSGRPAFTTGNYQVYLK